MTDSMIRCQKNGETYSMEFSNDSDTIYFEKTNLRKNILNILFKIALPITVSAVVVTLAAIIGSMYNPIIILIVAAGIAALTLSIISAPAKIRETFAKNGASFSDYNSSMKLTLNKLDSDKFDQYWKELSTDGKNKIHNSIIEIIELHVVYKELKDKLANVNDSSYWAIRELNKHIEIVETKRESAIDVLHVMNNEIYDNDVMNLLSKVSNPEEIKESIAQYTIESVLGKEEEKDKVLAVASTRTKNYADRKISLPFLSSIFNKN